MVQKANLKTKTEREYDEEEYKLSYSRKIITTSAGWAKK